MSPAEQLSILAARQAALQARLASRRAERAAGLAGAVALARSGARGWQAIPREVRWSLLPAVLWLARRLGRRFPRPVAWLRYASLAVRLAGLIAVLRRRLSTT